MIIQTFLRGSTDLTKCTIPPVLRFLLQFKGKAWPRQDNDFILDRNVSVGKNLGFSATKYSQRR
ncbi:hypothetical protein Fmac_002918 [Flemingia macrophylla]|uniref:Uncharacterized protein n=1 Tax=Flemingia macrophylla TaxID=520843 RepID=A0ABD1NN18_9FABA